MKQNLVGLLSGFLFAIGLAVAGMTDPNKIIGFLDFTGNWDPSLALVMVGALLVHFTAQRVLRGVHAPVFGSRFAVTSKRNVDIKLVAGAALFGLGWGAGGYCPGPLLVSSAARVNGAVIALVGMVVGTVVYRSVFARSGTQSTDSAAATDS